MDARAVFCGVLRRRRQPALLRVRGSFLQRRPGRGTGRADGLTLGGRPAPSAASAASSFPVFSPAAMPGIGSSQGQLAAARASKRPHDLMPTEQRHRMRANDRIIATLARLEPKRAPGVRRSARNRERPRGVSLHLAERVGPRVRPQVDHERTRLLVLDRQHEVRADRPRKCRVRPDRPRRRRVRALIRGARRGEHERRGEQSRSAGGASIVVA